VSALFLVAVLVLVLVNGFFVAAEFALVRARGGLLDDLAKEGVRGAPRAAMQADDVTNYLSSCQFGITLASLGIGFLGEPAIAGLLEPLFGDSISHGLSVAISIAIAYVLVTTVHVIAGEQVPKIYAIVNPEKVACWVSAPLQGFTVVMRPFVSGLDAASRALLRPLGINAVDLEGGAGAEDVKLLIAEGSAGGTLDPGEAGMLAGVFHLHEQEARQVMTPIPAVVTVDLSEDVETALRRCISSGHTRLLVTEDENQDRVKGMVHSNSLVRALMTEGPQAAIGPLVRDAPIVPETKPLDDLLAELQRTRSSMAVVIDEYGRVAGLVTVEDIIEEVVGEIDDETDPAGGAVRRLANGDWFVRGHVAVTDLADYGIDLPVDTDAYNSIGGLVFNELGRLPLRGDIVTDHGFSIRVESVRDNRVEALRIRPLPAAERDTEGDD
jgi:CBS domain containing-hemolysin-like protein